MKQRDLVKEYDELTQQLQDITRRRSEIGKLLAAEKAELAHAAALRDERGVIEALLTVAETGDLPVEAARLKVTPVRLYEMFSNVMRRVRTANPDHRDAIPVRVGPRALAKRAEWEKHVRAYLRKLK